MRTPWAFFIFPVLIFAAERNRTVIGGQRPYEPPHIVNETIATLAPETITALRETCPSGRFQGPCVSSVLAGVREAIPLTPYPGFRQHELGFDLVYLLVHEQESEVFNEAAKLARRRHQLGSRIRQLTPNYTVRPTSNETAPADPLYPQQQYLSAINLQPLWDRSAPLSMTDQNLGMFIIDTGINAKHPDLAGHIETGLSRDFVGDNPLQDPIVTHGTDVAGIATAIHNTIGIAGISSQRVGVFRIFRADVPKDPGPFRTVDWFSTASETLAAVQAIAALPFRRKIVNMSFSTWDIPELREAMKVQTDVLWISAAGNYGPNGISYPAAYDLPNHISVGSAADLAGHFSSSSNRIGVKLLALGENILTTSGTDSYAAVAGTSVSAPQVFGVAGELSKIHPEATPVQLAQALLTPGNNPALPGFGLKFAENIPMLNAGAALAVLDGKNPSASPVSIVGATGVFSWSQTLSFGDVISLYGRGFTSQATQATNLSQLPTELGGVSVLLNGTFKLPLYYAGTDQVNVLLPTSLFMVRGSDNNTLTVTTREGNAVWQFRPTAVSPAFVTYNGTLWIEDGRGNKPAILQPGAQVTCFATGLGAVLPDPLLGHAGSGTEQIRSAITATMGSQKLSVQARLDTAIAGLYRVTFTLPPDLTDSITFISETIPVTYRLPR